MSDWLNEIETGTKRMLELDVVPPFLSFYKERERMARVVRELSAYIKANKAVEQCQAKHSSLEMIGLINTRLEAEQGLSPDAKEVIDELLTLQHAD